MNNKTTVGFIGFGQMGKALGKGMTDYQVIPARHLYACSQHYEKLLEDCKGWGISIKKDPKEVIKNSEVVILAVKPDQLEKVIGENKEELQAKIVISIAAVHYFADLEKMFLPNTHHLSAMPNTPIEVGQGIMILEDQSSLTKAEMKLFKELFEPISLLVTLDPKSFSVGGTIAGCAPAFTAMYIEALGDAGVKYGLKREKAYELAAKMLIGTGELYLKSHKHPALMKDEVCSPGGSTIRGVTELEKDSFKGAVINAVDAIEKK